MAQPIYKILPHKKDKRGERERTLQKKLIPNPEFLLKTPYTDHEGCSFSTLLDVPEPEHASLFSYRTFILDRSEGQRVKLINNSH